MARAKQDSTAMQTEIPGEILESLYPAIGALILNWALLESVIEKWVAVIYHEANGIVIRRKLPRMWGQKVKFIRQCFDELPVLSPWKDWGLSYLDRAEALVTVRHTVTHGALAGYDRSKNALLFIRLDLDQEKKIHVSFEEYLSIPNILNAGTESTELCHSSALLCRHMLDTLAGGTNLA